ncbi:MAG: S8 family peptidase [Bacteroidota bacterium]
MMTRKFLLIVLFIGFTLDIIAQINQTKLSGEFTEIIQCKKKNVLIPKSYYSSQVNCVEYIHAVGLINNKFNQNKTTNRGIIVGSIINQIVTLRIPISMINDDLNISGVTYLSPSHRIVPMLNKVVKDTRVDSVQKGYSLPQPFSGKDVFIGITDWGFDYTNPMFYDTTLSHTRIFKAWDQYRNAGPAPTGFTYGTEISGESDLLAAQCDTFNIYQWATHGSHVAGICGGSGAGTIYRGVAYDANYLMATFLVDEASVIDAFNWMKNVATQEQKRLVVNMSWGLYWMGNLDGTSLISQAIDALSSQGVVFVASAGNNGDETFHIKKQFISSADTMKTVIGFNNYGYYPTMWGQSVTAWGEPNHAFNFSIKILNTSNQEISSTANFPTSTNGYIDTLIVIGSDTIFYNILRESSNFLNQRPHARIRVKNKSSLYKIALHSTADSGTVHYWNLIELTNDVGNWGGPFVNPLPDYTAGDAFYSIGEPACSQSVISIAAHNSETVLPSGSVTGGARSTFSSIGPTLDGRTKPDISAPGFNVASSISSFTNSSIDLASVVNTILFNGRSYRFVRFSGTSMSGPAVTGIVALMLQANPLLTPVQIKTIIHQTARFDSYTGIIGDTGSVYWGWGKVHALKAVKRAFELVNINETDFNNLCSLYPIPAKDKIWCMFDESFKPTFVEIFALDGRKVAEYDFVNTNQLEVSGLKGVFFIKFKSKTQQITKKVIIQ